MFLVLPESSPVLPSLPKDDLEVPIKRKTLSSEGRFPRWRKRPLVPFAQKDNPLCESDNKHSTFRAKFARVGALHGCLLLFAF